MLSHEQDTARLKAQKESVCFMELGVLEPHSSPHHAVMVLSRVEESAVALVTGASSVSTTRRA